MSSCFHSASLSSPILSANCRYNLHLFRLFRSDSSNIDKEVLLRKYQEEDEEEAVTKKAIKELEIFVS